MHLLELVRLCMALTEAYELYLPHECWCQVWRSSSQFRFRHQCCVTEIEFQAGSQDFEKTYRRHEAESRFSSFKSEAHWCNLRFALELSSLVCLLEVALGASSEWESHTMSHRLLSISCLPNRRCDIRKI